MGCALCRPLSARSLHLNKEHFRSLLRLKDLLHLTRRDIDRMHGLFNRIDRDKSGCICYFEFLMHLDLDKSPFVEKAFMLANVDSADNMDFAEFVGSLYVYCTLSWDTLVKYAFDVCDVDRSGVLEVREVEELVRSVYGKALDARVEQLLRVMDSDCDGTISFDEFRARNRQHPLLLFPAFHMQERMRHACLGASYWRKRERDVDPEMKAHIVEILQGLDPDHPERQERNAARDAAKRRERAKNGGGQRASWSFDDDGGRERRKSHDRGKRPSRSFDDAAPRERRRSRNSDDDFESPLSAAVPGDGAAALDERRKRRSRDLAHAKAAKQERAQRKSKDAHLDPTTMHKSAYERELESDGYHKHPRVDRKTPTPEDVARMFDRVPGAPEEHHKRHPKKGRKGSRVAPEGGPRPPRESLMTKVVRTASGKFKQIKQFPARAPSFTRKRKSKYAAGGGK